MSKVKKECSTVTVADTFPRMTGSWDCRGFTPVDKLSEPEIDTLKKVQIGSSSVGIKHDQGKPDLTMIPYEALEEIAKVLMFGATKYDKNNWKKGISTTRLIASAMRHLGQFNSGIDTDNESSLSHVAHAATNLLMLIWMMKHKKELDDRHE